MAAVDDRLQTYQCVIYHISILALESDRSMEPEIDEQLQPGKDSHCLWQLQCLSVGISSWNSPILNCHTFGIDLLVIVRH